MTRSPAQVFAANLLAGFVAEGVEHAFVSPGSRSQALAIAAWQLAENGALDLRVRLDERSAAFQALGVGKLTGMPALLICTSGTAVANYHPAALEAHHSGVPMVLLTADRPLELRGTGSNQTTNQVGIFADSVGLCIDVEAPAADESDDELAARARQVVAQVFSALAERPEPVQVNVCLREPLSGMEPSAADVLSGLLADLEFNAEEGADTDAESGSGSGTESEGCGDHCNCHAASGSSDTVIDLGLKTIVVAGDGGYLAEYYCHGIPLFAEPSSGVRHLPQSLLGYLAGLKNAPELLEQVEQVLVFGKPTLTRPIQALIKREGIKLYVEPGLHDAVVPTASAIKLGDDVDLVGEPSLEWFEAWAKACELPAASAQTDGPLTRAQLVAEVYAASGKNTPLLLGASSLIREADRVAPAKEVPVFANRGLAGIDGTVATALGMAAATARKVTGEASQGTSKPKVPMTRALMGDLTLFHDAGSLAVSEADQDLQLQIVVGNDNGGSIFNGLEVAQTIEAKPFETLFKTPQRVSIKALAEAYGWRYLLVENTDELREALKATGLVLIEAVLA
jgi:2-succinyl-5-enolpyruvyl-6-hydroxy-3-cyclohexene-1-carboxylate synthase